MAYNKQPSAPPQAPPIQYLPAFVAAAQLGSFRAAAQQLNVTPSAISQQIKSLEQRIGLSLFSRQGKELQLSQAGEEFFSFAAHSLGHYQQGWEGFAEQFLSPQIRISMTDYVANRIIIPRLADFMEHSGIPLEIHTSSRNQNLQANTLDAAIRFGTPPWPEHHARVICDAQVAMVASPEYWRQHPLTCRQHWQHQTLIHARRVTNDWQRLEQSQGYTITARQQLMFDSYETAIEAAKAGLGIMLASFPTSNQELRSGVLQAHSEKRFSSGEHFYLITKPNDHKEKRYQQLFSWLSAVFAEL